MRKRAVLVAVILTVWFGVLLACGGAPTPGSATSASTGQTRQQVWERCSSAIRQASCEGSVIYVAMCMRPVFDRYHGQATDADAVLVLQQHGCPPAMTQGLASVAEMR